VLTGTSAASTLSCCPARRPHTWEYHRMGRGAIMRRHVKLGGAGTWRAIVGISSMTGP